jgi:hypothetical protein
MSGECLYSINSSIQAWQTSRATHCVLGRMRCGRRQMLLCSSLGSRLWAQKRQHIQSCCGPMNWVFSPVWLSRVSSNRCTSKTIQGNHSLRLLFLVSMMYHPVWVLDRCVRGIVLRTFALQVGERAIVRNGTCRKAAGEGRKSGETTDRRKGAGYMSISGHPFRLESDIERLLLPERRLQSGPLPTNGMHANMDTTQPARHVSISLSQSGRIGAQVDHITGRFVD